MKKILSVFMCLLMALGCCTNGLAADISEVNAVVYDTAEYIYKTVSNPQVASIGGEWAVLGLARSGAEIPREYYAQYYKNAEEYTAACVGILHDKKYTEYSRVILALTAIGENPAEVAGYNLLTPLGDYENTVRQGINGAVWALLALDSGNYEIPRNDSAGVQATRDMYINYILEKQASDGGWALSGGSADSDITGMALQALAKYQNNEKVREATEKALMCMSEKQNESGGFSSEETETSESCAQMLVALCELGISADDERFVKNGSTVFDALLSYKKDGGFEHIAGDGVNQMATEQCLYAAAALKRAMEGKNSLYRMSDAASITDGSNAQLGLYGKNDDVKKTEIVSGGRTFDDISEHKNKKAVEELAARNIINGKTENVFDPNATMTRAEFAAITVRGLGLPLKNNESAFYDVNESDWFYGFVNTAFFYGIVNGVSVTAFNPEGTITREEAAVMTARAADLCGIDTHMDAFEARNILAGFSDYVKASDWAIASLAFCCDKGILNNDEMEIKPKGHVTRAEIAQMLYNMLVSARLLP